MYEIAAGIILAGLTFGLFVGGAMLLKQSKFKLVSHLMIFASVALAAWIVLIDHSPPVGWK